VRHGAQEGVVRFQGRFGLALEGFPNVVEGPSTVTGSAIIQFGVNTPGTQLVVRAPASGHISGACAVDYIYEFQAG
jgi:hypothetical protein